MEIRWVSRGSALLGYLGRLESPVFTIARGQENIMVCHLPGIDTPSWSEREWELQELADRQLEKFCREAGLKEG